MRTKQRSPVGACRRPGCADLDSTTPSATGAAGFSN